MGRVFAHITQFRSNLPQWTVRFLVLSGLCPIRDLPPGTTRKVKQSRILRCCRERGTDWKIGIFINRWFTGMELSPLDVLRYTRIVISDEWNGQPVLCVHGVRENRTSDHLLRLRFFGCLRNIFWDQRPIVLIDWVEATKLRQIASRVLPTRGNKHGKNRKIDDESPRSSVISFAALSSNSENTDHTKQMASPVSSTKAEQHVKDSGPGNDKTVNPVDSTVDDESLRSPLLSFPDNKSNYLNGKTPVKERPQNIVTSTPSAHIPKNEKMIPNSPPQDGSIRRRSSVDSVIGTPVRGEVMGWDSRYVLQLPRAPVVHANHMDSFVHVLLLLLAFAFICLIKALY